MKYVRLTVIEGTESKAGKRLRKKVQCICDCGTIVNVFMSDLKTAKTKSCGCLRRESASLLGKNNTTHGHSRVRSLSYNTWYAMRKRCGRSGIYEQITYDPKWDCFETFLFDMGQRPINKTLDRIDNKKGYFKENCRWSTRKEQTLNRSTTRWFIYEGRKLCLKDWAKELGLNVIVLENRLIKKKMTIADVILDFENLQAG